MNITSKIENETEKTVHKTRSVYQTHTRFMVMALLGMIVRVSFPDFPTWKAIAIIAGIYFSTLILAWIVEQIKK